MKILFLDCQAGISGDMSVAALLDLGVPLEYLQTEMRKLGLPCESYSLSTSGTERHHMVALKFDVTVHDHHTHRHYAGIDAMIAASALSAAAREKSRLIFRRLAEAEAKVHGVAVADVHFHEVGAVDSIVDIVAIAVCLDYLKVEKIFVSALPLGGGFVETAHGRLPVPAPATAELLKGMLVHGDCGTGERVTPTGAAFVAALAECSAKQPPMLLEKTGCGAGAKDFPDCPNVVRAFLGRSVEKNAADDEVMVVEANIDDSTPEILGYTMEMLFEKGALDVFFTPIQMKKNRPAVMLSLLCRTQQLDDLARLLMTETTAIGLRYYRADRIIMQRRIVERQSEFGLLRYKQVLASNGDVLSESPEYEDCRRIAREKDIPCRVVMLALQQSYRSCEAAAGMDEAVAKLLLESGMTLSLAESCSGGLIAKRITDIPGSSRYFIQGVVTYSNEAKTKLLGVSNELLESCGAVSDECASAMATGIRSTSGSDLGLAVTGIAGPDGGSEDKPVGTVFISLATPDGCKTERFQFNGNREEVRKLTAWNALDRLRIYLLKKQ